MARMAALSEALTPTVATGMPGGIWMMESMASSPSSIPLMGTPMTGSVVLAAITPGKAAAMPAAAMITFIPRLSASRANCSTASGVRCAERALTSKAICCSFRKARAFSMTGRSLVLPMITLTMGFMRIFLFMTIYFLTICPTHPDIRIGCPGGFLPVPVPGNAVAVWFCWSSPVRTAGCIRTATTWG